MAKYEQEITLQEVINGNQGAMDALSGLVNSPIPGDKVSFRKFLPNGSFGNANDRVSYALDHLFPLWQRELSNNPNRIMSLIDDLIGKGQQ
ncbi:MAG: hypothetical protein MSG64_18950 [Pyrinomonadaceae bacterium MAG19_C2-C3]|nr:hypothetical protein [Pyrinomonadaceae bacterium MAG19_C2-C3]